jgi:hypothetical protein
MDTLSEASLGAVTLGQVCAAADLLGVEPALLGLALARFLE